MSKRTLEPPRLGIAAAYLIFFTLVLWPVVDFFIAALPMHWERVEWRYASVGLMAAYLSTPVLGLGMGMALAFFLRQGLLLRALSVLCLLGAAFLILAMFSLGLDVIQLGKVTTPEGLPSLRAAGLVAEFKLLSGIVALALLGAAGWRADRRLAEATSGREDAPRAPWLGSRPDKA